MSTCQSAADLKGRLGVSGGDDDGGRCRQHRSRRCRHRRAEAVVGSSISVEANGCGGVSLGVDGWRQSSTVGMVNPEDIDRNAIALTGFIQDQQQESCRPLSERVMRNRNAVHLDNDVLEKVV
ncbi:hypothetical protein ACLOJK_015047, partial [Asimina triloba]